MNKQLSRFGIIFVLFCVFSALAPAQNKYIGTKMCGMCHKTKKQGEQLGIWEKAAHSSAYKTLTTAKANEIAKSKGISKPAAEAAECLSCHAPQHDAKNVEKTFKIEEGVQCETCHGAGSAYKAITVMKDHEKAVAAGMTDFKDTKTIEAKCKSCHNEQSPTFKGFKFEEYWDKIKHPLPKAG